MDIRQNTLWIINHLICDTDKQSRQISLILLEQYDLMKELHDIYGAYPSSDESMIHTSQILSNINGQKIPNTLKYPSIDLLATLLRDIINVSDIKKYSEPLEFVLNAIFKLLKPSQKIQDFLYQIYEDITFNEDLIENIIELSKCNKSYTIRIACFRIIAELMAYEDEEEEEMTNEEIDLNNNKQQNQNNNVNTLFQNKNNNKSSNNKIINNQNQNIYNKDQQLEQQLIQQQLQEQQQERKTLSYQIIDKMFSLNFLDIIDNMLTQDQDQLRIGIQETISLASLILWGYNNALTLHYNDMVIQSLSQHRIWEILINLTQQTSLDNQVLEEILLCIANAMELQEKRQIFSLNKLFYEDTSFSLLNGMIEVIDNIGNNASVMVHSMTILDFIFQDGQRQLEMNEYDINQKIDNPFVDIFEGKGGLDMLLNLNNNYQNQAVAQASSNLINKYNF